MTLREIAEEVGVSISTVSRVINSRNIHAASPEVQQAIWECARKKGYKNNAKIRKSCANLEEKNVSVSPLKVIACIFARDSVTVSDNSFFMGIAKCFERTALTMNYTVQNYFTALEVNQRNIETLSGQHIDGVVVIGRHDDALVESLSRVIDNIVYTGLARPVSDLYDSIICDRYEIGRTCTEYLLSLNHKKIAYIGETENEITYDGYSSLLIESGLEFIPDYVVNVNPNLSNGYQAMRKLLSLPCRPTAVFCMNDYLAIGAMKALNDYNVRCPDDISIIGVDDIETTLYTTPKLTTIHTPMEELGTIASKILIDRIEGGHTIVTRTTLPFNLVERESCKYHMSE